MVRLSLHLLGSFRATLGDQPVSTFESDKVRALLAYLAVESDRAHRREKLVGLLWPEHPERRARHSLNQALFNLRRAIADREATSPFLLVTRQTLQFNPQSDHWLDVATFVGLLDACETHRHRRLATCEACMERLHKAVSLHRGSFLEGFSLPDSASFEEWALLERERLQRLAVDTLRRVAECHERRGEYEEALRYIRRWVGSEPWRERAHRRLMRVLALSGQSGAALAQYEACRSVLGEELGVEPGEETKTLYERIRNGTELESLSRTSPHNLPSQLTPFVGRDAMMIAIDGWLQDPACRLLNLVGPGGSGKTRLAIEAGVDLLDDFEHGAFFVSLAALQSVVAIVPTIAQALSLSLHGGSEPLQQLLNYLSTKSLLLILDNFEHFIPAPWEDRGGVKLVLDILRATQSVKILVTSRARLNVQSEQVFPVRGMDYPLTLVSVPGPSDKTAKAPDAGRYSAVELFLQSARRVRPSFEPEMDDLTRVAEICHLVQGMPLGILLAAAWLPMLSPDEIAAQLSQSFDFLEANLRDLPQRQRSMRAVFDRSWHLLAQREQEVFAGLSVFRGGFTYQAAREITGASLRELMMLVNRSLLHRTPAERYEVHELLRQYAVQRLERSPSGADVLRDRHCAFFTAALHRLWTEQGGPRQEATLVEMEGDIENARVAWNWAAEREQIERLDWALEGLCRVYERRGRFQEGEAACRLAAERLRASGKPVDEKLCILARARAWQGYLTLLTGHAELAHQLLGQALTLLGDPSLAAEDTRAERGFILRWQGASVFNSNREEARQLWKQSLAIREALGDQWGTANVLSDLGRLSNNVGDYGAAEQMLRESLAIRRALRDPWGIAAELSGLFQGALSQGRFEEAERLARECSAIRRELGGRVQLSGALFDEANVLMFLGEFAEAHTLLERSVAIRDDLGHRRGLSGSTVGLGWAKINLGLYGEAREQEQTAHTIS